MYPRDKVVSTRRIEHKVVSLGQVVVSMGRGYVSSGQGSIYGTGTFLKCKKLH